MSAGTAEEEDLVIVYEVSIRLTLGSFDNACSVQSFFFVQCNINKGRNKVTKDS